MYNNMNVNVSGPVSASATYKTVVLKPNMVDGVNLLTQEMMNSVNTKYVIKHDFVLTKDVVEDSVNVLSTNISQCVNPAYANALAAYNSAHDAWIDADNAYTNDPNETTLAAKNAAYAVYNAAQTTLNNTPQYYFYASKSISIKKHNHIELGEGAVLLNSALNGTIEFDVASSNITVYIGSTIPGTYSYTIKNAITMPSGCLIEFDGGSIDKGFIYGNDTVLIYRSNIEEVVKGTELLGTWVYNNFQLDKLDNTNGMGRIYLKKNKSLATQLTQPNTIYVIQYDFTLGEDITVPENCVLEFDGGSLSGIYTLTGQNTLLKGENIKIKKGIIIAGTWANDTIYTKWFEFVSTDDGTTDNVLQFKQLQNMINGTKGCKVEFENGYYQSSVLRNTPDSYVTIDGVTYPKWPMNTRENDTEIILHVLEVPYVDINLNGSTIKMINAVYPGATAIRIDGNGNSYIHDGTVIGMAINYDYPPYVNYANVVTNNYEFQLGVYQSGGFCTIYNMNVHHFNGDGITVGSSCWYYRDGRETPLSKYPAKGYIVRDSEVSYCGRNGIGVHSSDEGQLKNLHIHNVGSDAANGEIGSDGIMGRSPRTGIDVEFEDQQYRVPVMSWDSLYIHDCADKTFGFATPTLSKMKNFNCANSIFIGFALLNNLNSETGNNVFDNCYFEKPDGYTSIEGSLRGSYITFNDCSFIFKKDNETYLGSYQTFKNCTFLDERENASIRLFGNNLNIGSLFKDCTFSIKGPIGYLGTSSTFKNCIINVPVVQPWFVGDTEFYDCIFNNIVEDSSLSFQFKTGVGMPMTTGLKLIGCSFDIGRGIGNTMDSFFFEVKLVTVENCIFKTTLSFVMSDERIVSLKNVISPNVYSRPYSTSGSTLEPYKLTLDGCSFDKFYLQVNNDDRYDNSLTIKNSNIIAYNEFNNVNIEGGKFNSDTRMNVAKIRAKNSIIELPSVIAANTSTYVLENCYVSGVSEADFQGTAINCTFQVPFPKSGTFANRPTTSPVGFKYFCTDKQTAEGATDGIEIIHKGSDVWVDALGRVVS